MVYNTAFVQMKVMINEQSQGGQMNMMVVVVVQKKKIFFGNLVTGTLHS